MLKVLTPSQAFRPWIVVLSVAGATILPTYLSGALTVALPTIGAQIGLASTDLQVGSVVDPHLLSMLNKTASAVALDSILSCQWRLFTRQWWSC